MASTPAKRNASISPIAGTAYVNELNDALSRALGPTTGIPPQGGGRVQRFPVQIAAQLTPPGVYSVRIGSWKAQLKEGSVISLSSLFEYPNDANGIAFVPDEIEAGTGHALAVGKTVFGEIQPTSSDESKFPVFEIVRPLAILDMRVNAGKDHIEVTYDNTNWVNKIPLKTCT